MNKKYDIDIGDLVLVADDTDINMLGPYALDDLHAAIVVATDENISDCFDILFYGKVSGPWAACELTKYDAVFPEFHPDMQS